MITLKIKSTTICLLLFLFISTGNISAQQPKGKFLPKYPVKSAVIQYQLSRLKNWNGDSIEIISPYFKVTFDDYGALVRKELKFSLAGLLDNPVVMIYRNDYKYSLDDPKDCITKRQIRDADYDEDLNGDGVNNKRIQDLIHNKINKKNQSEFRSFNETGNELYLGLNCKRYQYIYENRRWGGFLKYIYLVYHDICLSSSSFTMNSKNEDFLVSRVEAFSFEENIPIPPATFELPGKFRVIDGEKLDETSKEAASGFSTLIVNYTTKREYGQQKEEGKKRIYIKDKGKTSALEYEGTIAEYNLSPESKHFKKIRDEESELLVNYVSKTVRRRELVKGNYNDKSIAELNYYFDNGLYDTTVKLLGESSFLGKTCKIFEIKTGIEKLEVLEWQGVFLQVKQYICTDGPDCKKYQITAEETAVSIQENAVIPESAFEYPENFARN